MNLKLKIEEDAELRAYIKDLIKGQVLSIGRKEIKSILEEIIKQKHGNDITVTEKIIKDILEVDNYYNSEIKAIARECFAKEAREVFKKYILKD